MLVFSFRPFALPMIWLSNANLLMQALFYKKVQIMSFFLHVSV